MMVVDKAYGGRAVGIALGIAALVLLMAGGAGAAIDGAPLPHKPNLIDFILHPPDASMPFPEDFENYRMQLSNQSGRKFPFPSRTHAEAIQRGMPATINRTLPVRNIERAAVGITSTITVNASGGADYTRIQDAINNASHGDTILVYSGTYYENVDVNKQLILRGIDNGSGAPAVDAGGSGNAITLSAGWSTLEGFVAENGSSSGYSYWGYGGIKVNSNNNIIENNNASNNDIGISLYSSSNNTLSGNNALNNKEEGIFLVNSNNNTLSYNNASSNYYEACYCFPSGYGIHLYSSNNNNLSGNKALNNDNGIFIGGSSNNTLNSNIASNNYEVWSRNGYGIYLASSGNNTLINNIMEENENNFEIDWSSESDFDNYIDTSNLVNGKPIYYIKGAANAVYDFSTNAGTFYCISCVNVTLKNLNLSTKNNTAGIFFWNTSLSNIQNITASNNDIGIYLYFSSNNILSGNNASNNRNNGIYIRYSTDNTISGNIASNNDNGISLYDSSNNTLTNNRMIENKYNFGVYWEWYGSDFDSIFDNQIDTTNLVNGKPIYYVKDATNTVFDSNTNAGTFYCINCINVTVKNLNLNNNRAGIFFWNTTNSKIQNVNAFNNSVGFEMLWSSNNTLSGNNASNNYYGGIVLHYSSNNIININNALSNYGNGIRIYDSNNNILIGNNATSNLFGGINLFSSSNSTLIGNNALSNSRGIGIDLYDSNNNILSGNNASNNRKGIAIQKSSNNNLTNNLMIGNKYNFGLDGGSGSDFENQIDPSNWVNGKPIYYIKNAINAVYDSSTNAGTFYCINCVNITVKDMDLNENDVGIFFWHTTSSKIQKVNASNTSIGIWLLHSSNNNLSDNNVSNNIEGILLFFSNDNNKISDNDVSNNSYTGIYVDGNYNLITGNNASNNNEGIILYGVEQSIYHNNFINNSKNAHDSSPNNFWDSGYPSGGNYWSDYTGADNFSGANRSLPGSDGIGDTPYNISGGAGAQDRYPFMSQNGWLSPIDSTPPTVIANPPSYQRGKAANNRSIIGLNVSAIDPIINGTSAGLKNASVNASRINNTGWITLINQSGFWKGNATFDKYVADGNYLLNVTVYDNAGNINDSVQINISIDNTPPSVTEVSLTSLVEVGRFTNITAIISDNFELNTSDVYPRVKYPNGSSINYAMIRGNVTATIASSENVSPPSLSTTGGGSGGYGYLFYFNFTDTAQYGRYDVTIIANDTTGNTNNSEKTWFVTTKSNSSVVLIHGGGRGETAYGPKIWNRTSFTGLVAEETLNVQNVSGRSIPERNLWYNTTRQIVRYKVNEANSSLTVEKGLDINGNKVSQGGYYAKIGWQGIPYVAFNGKANKISRLILEQGLTDSKTLTIGETWDMGDGFSLKFQSTDIKALPKQAWLTLYNGSTKLDDRVVDDATRAVYTFAANSLAGENDVPIFVTYADNISSNSIRLKYTWLISDNVTNINAGDNFGNLEVMQTSDVSINITNKSAPISLSQNSTTNLMDDLSFRVANNGSLEYYPFFSYIGPTYMNASENMDVGLEILTNSSVAGSFKITKMADTPPAMNRSLGLAPFGKYISIITNVADTLNWMMIKIYYTEDELGASGLDENSLRISWYNESSNGWETLAKGSPSWVNDVGVSTANLNNYSGYVWANISHLSFFALVGSYPTTTPSRGDGGGSSGGGGGGGGGPSGENYTNIEVKENYDLHIFKDRVTSYRFTDRRNPVMFVNITGNISAGEINAAVEVLKNTSTLIKPPTPAPGIVYKNVNIWVGTTGFAVPKNIKIAVIRFKVLNIWLESNSIATNEIRMVRWDGSKWITLDTGVKEKDSTNTYFEAATDTFSPFAITGLKEIPKAVPAVVTETKAMPAATPVASPAGKKIPGFEIVLVIATLSGVYMFSRKRR